MEQELMKEERMTSLQIAEEIGKEHKNVLRDIRNMEASWVKVNGRRFELVDYIDAKGEKRPCYSLTKIECLYIATKYNDEARAKLVLRWEMLEKAHQVQIQKALPKSFSEALRMLADETEKNERLALENKEKQKVIAEQQPKVLFADSILASKTSCLIGELAKILTQNGYKIGQNKLFKWLRGNGYLCSRGEQYNLPQQKYVDCGLFEIKKSTHSENEVLITTSTTKVTPKGQQYFVNKFLHFIK
jgi:anti-repressor protein